MPVAVICSSCAARLNAPDNLIGKKVKCPKCSTPLTVPDPADADGFEVVDDPPPQKTPTAKAVAAKPARPAVADEDDDDRPRKRTPTRDGDDEPVKSKARRPAREEDDDDEPVKPKSRRPAREEGDDEPAKPRKAAALDDGDEDDDEDDRPRRKPPAKKSKLPLILLGVGVAVFLLCGGFLGLGYYLSMETQELAKRGGLGPNGGQALTNALVGPDWVRFEAPDGSFAIKFPNGPPTEGDPMAMMEEEMKNLPDTPQNAEAKKMMEQMKGMAKDMMKSMGAKLWTRTDGGRNYSVSTLGMAGMGGGGAGRVDMMAEASAAQQKQFGATVAGNEKVTVAGRPGRQLTVDKASGKRDIIRMLLAGDKMISIAVSGDKGLSPDDSVVKAFFESFESNLKDTPPPQNPSGGTPKGGTPKTPIRKR